MNILIVPSTTLISPEMQKRVGAIPPVLFPFAKKTMLEQIVNNYNGLVDKIIIVVNQQSELVEDYVHFLKLPVEVIRTDKIDDLGYSILCAMNFVQSNYKDIDSVYINFGDTLATILKNDSKDNLYYSESEQSNIWTFFLEKGGVLTEIKDKKDVKDTSFDKNKFFIGIFRISDFSLFLKHLSLAYSQKNSEIDSFYISFMSYSRIHPFSFLKAIDWIDIGHSSEFNTAKTGVEARSFNTVSIDEERGILVKKSKNVDKFIHEIKWYVRMPARLQYAIPRIYRYSTDYSDAFIEMEYYGYPTLHELLIFGNLPLLKWMKIFRKLQYTLQDFSKYVICDKKDIFIHSMYDMYITKTCERLNEIRNTLTFQNFFTKDIIINNHKYKSLDEYLALLSDLFKTLVDEKFLGSFSIIHGDCCFSNLLLEDNFNFIRMIDPRGKFGDFDLYGDQNYDYAKLFHSLEGGYDYIIENRFSLNREDNKITYSLYRHTKEIFSVFKNVFNFSYEQELTIRFIEATLFLSMVPLHSDNEERQIVMLSTGIELLQDVINSQNK